MNYVVICICAYMNMCMYMYVVYKYFVKHLHLHLHIYMLTISQVLLQLCMQAYIRIRRHLDVQRFTSGVQVELSMP